MDCPRCDGSLSPLRGKGNVIVDYCDHCGGVWYDAGEFASFYEVFGPIPVLAEGANPTIGVTCPRCTVAMVEVSYPPYDGVRVDTCRDCDGLWLDKGEAVELREKVRALQAKLLPMLPDVEEEEQPTESPAVKINWAWVVGGIAIIIASELTLSGFLNILSALDDLGDKDPRLSAPIVSAISSLLSFPVGGFFIGRFSPGFTVWEPALAAIPAAAWMVVREGDTLGYIIATVIVLAGIALSVFGAAAGEFRQSAGE